MAIARDSGASTFPIVDGFQDLNISSRTSPTFSTSAAQCVLIVCVGWRNNNNIAAPHSVNWNGSTPPGASGWTQVVAASNKISAIDIIASSIWIATTTQALSNAKIDVHSALADTAQVASISIDALTGASATITNTGTAFSAGSVVNRFITLPSVQTGSWLFVAHSGDGATALTNQTNTVKAREDINAVLAGQSEVGYNSAGISGSISVGWTGTQDFTATCACEVVVGSPPSPPNPFFTHVYSPNRIFGRSPASRFRTPKPLLVPDPPPPPGNASFWSSKGPQKKIGKSPIGRFRSPSQYAYLVGPQVGGDFEGVELRSTTVLAQATGTSLRSTTALAQATSTTSRSTTALANIVDTQRRSTLVLAQAVATSRRSTTALGQATATVRRSTLVSANASGTVRRSTTAFAQAVGLSRRSTAIQTQATGTTRRATKASGQATDVSRRSTKASGQATNVTRRSTTASGQATSTSRRSTKASGQATDVSRRSTKVSGQATDITRRSTTVSANVAGGFVGTTLRSTTASGQATGITRRSTSAQSQATGTTRRSTTAQSNIVATQRRSTTVKGQASDTSRRSTTAQSQATATSRRSTTTSSQTSSISRRSTTVSAQASNVTRRSVTVTAQAFDTTRRSTTVTPSVPGPATGGGEFILVTTLSGQGFVTVPVVPGGIGGGGGPSVREKIKLKQPERRKYIEEPVTVRVPPFVAHTTLSGNATAAATVVTKTLLLVSALTGKAVVSASYPVTAVVPRFDTKISFSGRGQSAVTGGGILQLSTELAIKGVEALINLSEEEVILLALDLLER